MQYRTLGRTGLSLSEIGYGAWGISNSGWLGANDAESARALHRAIEHGLNFIDTALAYGDGHSERLIGEVLRARSEPVHVATKIPPKNRVWPSQSGAPVHETFPGEYVIECTEQSLRNLGVETIDLQQFHVWSDDWIGQGDWLEAVERLKRQGKLRFFGISVNDHQPDNVIKLIETGVVDSVQVIYNIFTQDPEDRLFPACQRHDVGVIVRVPLDEGGLTGAVGPDTVFPEGDFRNTYFSGERKQEVYARVQQLTGELGIATEQLAETALRFALSHPAVTTVIPGMRSLRNVERNCPVGDGRRLAPEQLELLRRHRWLRNYYVA